MRRQGQRRQALGTVTLVIDTVRSFCRCALSAGRFIASDRSSASDFYIRLPEVEFCCPGLNLWRSISVIAGALPTSVAPGPGVATPPLVIGWCALLHIAPALCPSRQAIVPVQRTWTDLATQESNICGRRPSGSCGSLGQPTLAELWKYL